MVSRELHTIKIQTEDINILTVSHLKLSALAAHSVLIADSGKTAN